MTNLACCLIERIIELDRISDGVKHYKYWI